MPAWSSTAFEPLQARPARPTTPRPSTLPVAMDGMIAAASAHLQSAPASSASRNQDAPSALLPEGPPVSLDDFADSFPLVPLPAVAQLGLGDLQRLASALQELLDSLRRASASAEDQQLAKYAARQLSLVRRQQEQLRAEARVRALIAGDPADAAASASVARPIFLTAAVPSPMAARRPRPRPASSSTSSSSPSSSSSSGLTASSSARHLPRSRKETLERAKALVRASNAARPAVASCSPFVIAAGDGGGKKRRRAVRKLTPDEAAGLKLRQQEKDKDARRQAAYRRLLARQELQAEKKKARSAGRTGRATASAHGGDALQSREAAGSDGAAGHGADGGGGSGSESDASEVSNLSEGDAEDEKQIMAMAVESPRLEDGDDGEGHDDRDGSELEAGSSSEDSAKGAETGGQVPQVSAPPPRRATPVFLRTSEEEEEEEEEERSLGGQETCRSARASRRLEAPTVGNDDEEKQREAIALQLQRFVSARAAAKLQQLQELQELQESSARRVFEAGSSSRGEVPTAAACSLADELSAVVGDGGVERGQAVAKDEPVAFKSRERFDQESARAGEEAVERPVVAASDELEPDPQRLGNGDGETMEGPAVTATALVPPLAIPSAVKSAPCTDYRSYFRSFHCILTSAFEQRAADAFSSSRESQSAVSASSSPSASDNSLRLQLKLYQGWQSIMQDYATVFGARIAPPSSLLPSASPFTAHYRINSTTRREVCEIVSAALDTLGDWEEHASGLGLKTTWNLLWTWSKPRVARQTLLVWQKVNHFEHAKALTRKDGLKRSVARYLAMGGRMKQAYESFVPKTFLLPQEYVAFVQAFQAHAGAPGGGAAAADGKASNVWIMKPVALSRGRGISLVKDLSDVVYGEQVVIQEYVADPLLLDGYKFDLRLYVLVTSFNPLEAFLYEDGFVRVCTRPYGGGEDLGDLFVHLTNSSIQKENLYALEAARDNPIHGAGGRDAGGTKMTLAYLWERLAAMGADVDKVRRDIDDVVLKSLLCGEDHIPFQVNSFDLLGYDILLDATFRPWLIEINASPSMARENALDHQVKDALILDTIRLVNPLRFDRAALVEVLARRLHELDSAAKRPHAHLRHPREAEELAARQLNEDLTAILRGAVPRGYGELPEEMGRFRRLCPHSSAYNQLVRLKRSCVRVERRGGGG